MQSLIWFPNLQCSGAILRSKKVNKTTKEKRKWKTKKDKANKEDSIKALNNLPTEGAVENEIIKTIYYDLKPMTAEDAKLKLQEKPQDRFITFINQETNKVNVLFKMKDNKNFGLVEPEA